MPFNPFDIPNIKVTSLNPRLPDPMQSLAQLMKMQIQQQRMALAAARAAGRGGARNYEGNPRLGRYAMVPQKDGTRKPVWVWGTTDKERDKAEAKAIDEARQEILAGDKNFQDAIAGFADKSKAGMTETLDKVRKEHLPRLAQTLGMSGEEASKYITGGLQKTLDDYSKKIDDAGVGTQIKQGLSQFWRNTVDAIAGIARTSEEQIAAGNANREAAAQDLKENAWQENLERMRAEGRSTVGEQLSSPFRAAAMHGTQLGAMIAPAMAAGAIGTMIAPGPGTLIGAGIGGALGAGLPSAGEAMARVAGDENLTPAQRAESIGTTGLVSGLTSGAIGAIPIGPASVARPALVRAALGRQVAKQGVPEAVLSRMAPGATEAEIKGAANEWIRGQAGTVLRPGPYTSSIYKGVAEHAVNAGILGGAFQLGSNAAYNLGTGQDLPVTEGLPEAVIGGAALGLPFGIGGRIKTGLLQGRPAGANPNFRPDFSNVPGTTAYETRTFATDNLQSAKVRPDRYQNAPFVGRDGAIYSLPREVLERYYPPVESPAAGPWENPYVANPNLLRRYDAPVEAPLTGPWENPTLPRTIYPEPVAPPPKRDNSVRSSRTPEERGIIPLFDTPRPDPDPMHILRRDRRVIPDDAPTDMAMLANEDFIRTKPTFDDFVNHIDAINEFRPADVTDLFKRGIERGLLSPGEVEVIAQGADGGAKYDAIHRAIDEAKVPPKKLSAEDALFASNPDFGAIEDYILFSAKSSKEVANVIKRAITEKKLTPELVSVLRENLLSNVSDRGGEKHKIIKGLDKGVKAGVEAVEKAEFERAMQEVENERQFEYAVSEESGKTSRVEPNGQDRARNADSENLATDSTVSANSERTPPAVTNSIAPETSVSSAPAKGGGDARPPAPNTRPIEEAPAAPVEQGAGEPENPVREPGAKPAAPVDAAGSEGTGKPEPAPEQLPGDAGNAAKTDGSSVAPVLTKEIYESVSQSITPDIIRKWTEAGHAVATIADDIKYGNWDIIKETLRANRLLDDELSSTLDRLNIYKERKFDEGLEANTFDAVLQNATDNSSLALGVQEGLRLGEIDPKELRNYLNITTDEKWRKDSVAQGLALYETGEKLPDSLRGVNDAIIKTVKKYIQDESRLALAETPMLDTEIDALVKSGNWKELRDTLLGMDIILPNKAARLLNELSIAKRKNPVNSSRALTTKTYPKAAEQTIETVKNYFPEESLTKLIADRDWEGIKQELSSREFLTPELEKQLDRLEQYSAKQTPNERAIQLVNDTTNNAIAHPTQDNIATADMQLATALQSKIPEIVEAATKARTRLEQALADANNNPAPQMSNALYQDEVNSLNTKLRAEWNTLNLDDATPGKVIDIFIKAAVGDPLTAKEKSLYTKVQQKGFNSLTVNRAALDAIKEQAAKQGITLTGEEAAKGTSSEANKKLSENPIIDTCVKK